MSFQKFKSDSYCVGGRHRSATTKIYCDIISKGSKVLIGYCSICNRKNYLTVSDNTMQAEGLGSFFNYLGKSSAKTGKKIATNVLKNPGRPLEITSNNATAAATKSPKAALTTLPDVIIFYHTAKGLHLGNFL